MLRINQVFLNACKNFESSKVDELVSPYDEMAAANIQHYLDSGAEALNIILSAVYNSKIKKVGNVLDLPCGHGRVLRHIKAAFPEAAIDACDINTSGIHFCEAQFGAQPIQSAMELTDINFPNSYDLIWVGSLFTHTAEEVTYRWISHLVNSLNYSGIMVFSLHGRGSIERGRDGKYIEDEKWQEIESEYLTKGYGHRSHESNGNYGISLSRASAFIRHLESMPEIRISTYAEGRWDNHQDIIVIEKRPTTKLEYKMETEADFPAFDLNIYKNSNPDLANAGITEDLDLYKHFIKFGQFAGRVFS